MYNVLPATRKALLIGPEESICKRAIISELYWKHDKPLSHLGPVGFLPIQTESFGCEELLIHNIPEAICTSDFMIQQQFASSEIILLCFDYHQRNKLIDGLQFVRKHLKEKPLFLIFYSLIDLDFNDERSLTASEIHFNDTYKVDEVFIILPRELGCVRQQIHTKIQKIIDKRVPIRLDR
ncbi:MAG: hypothetical protein K5Q00_02915 [Gammaproteobacteria bacterium]|nr:hypothetical protein [Gammaproteobacteria bacterium]